jgi:hypothetical protein
MIKIAKRISIAAFIVFYLIGVGLLLIPFLVCESKDAGVWESMADRGSWAVIIAVFAEIPEIFSKIWIGAHVRSAAFRSGVEKLRLGSVYKWLERHEFKIDIIAFLAWIVIMLGLDVELRSNQKARQITSVDNARLNAEAAEANFRSKQAEERIVILETERDKIAKQLLDTQLAASNAMSAASTATNVVNNANVAVVQNLNRRITPEQRAKFSQILEPLRAEFKAHPVKVYVSVQVSDLEAVSYAKQISGILTEAGISVEFQYKNALDAFPVGLFFKMKSAQMLVPPFPDIAKAFSEARIMPTPAPGQEEPLFPPDFFELWVGKKPVE